MNSSYEQIVALAESVRDALGFLHELDTALANHNIEALPEIIERAKESVARFSEQAEKVK